MYLKIIERKLFIRENIIIDMSDKKNKTYTHLPVLAAEVLACLNPKSGEVAVDGTTGLGGHAKLIADKLGSNGRLICLDRDKEALKIARENLFSVSCKVDFFNCEFSRLDTCLNELEQKNIDLMLLDIGVSSLQLDKAERGFSFMHNGPLDMRMNDNDDLTAKEIVNSWSESDLADIFYYYGEERLARCFAKSIVENRTKMSIETTEDLVNIITSSTKIRRKQHIATKVFQALRIVVNNELEELKAGLKMAVKALNNGGRLGVITFHSLEDRLVKQAFSTWAKKGLVNLVNKKAIACSKEEQKINKRARSAKLRVIEKKC